jgi:hypothetical protein
MVLPSVFTPFAAKNGNKNKSFVELDPKALYMLKN